MLGSILRTSAQCGGGGIRTPGTLRYAGFQDQCIQPLCHPSGVQFSACRQTVSGKSGEGGIRTHDELLTHTPLAGERLQPLGHLSQGPLRRHVLRICTQSVLRVGFCAKFIEKTRHSLHTAPSGHLSKPCEYNSGFMVSVIRTTLFHKRVERVSKHWSEVHH